MEQEVQKLSRTIFPVSRASFRGVRVLSQSRPSMKSGAARLVLG